MSRILDQPSQRALLLSPPQGTLGLYFKFMYRVYYSTTLLIAVQLLRAHTTPSCSTASSLAYPMLHM